MRRSEGSPQALAVRHVELGQERSVAGQSFDLRLVRRHQLCGVPQVNATPQGSEHRQEIIWAPWRIDYVVEPKEDGCFLCDALACEDDERNFVLERRQRCFSILNRFPYNNGHLLVAPNAHKAELIELADDELVDLVRLTRDTQVCLGKAITPHGFNIGLNLGLCAGAGVPGHLHIHIVPRWNGDTNFMPVTAATKVIVQSIEALYRLLRDQLSTS